MQKEVENLNKIKIREAFGLSENTRGNMGIIDTVKDVLNFVCHEKVERLL